MIRYWVLKTFSHRLADDVCSPLWPNLWGRYKPCQCAGWLPSALQCSHSRSLKCAAQSQNSCRFFIQTRRFFHNIDRTNVIIAKLSSPSLWHLELASDQLDCPFLGKKRTGGTKSGSCMHKSCKVAVRSHVSSSSSASSLSTPSILLKLLTTYSDDFHLKM